MMEFVYSRRLIVRVDRESRHPSKERHDRPPALQRLPSRQSTPEHQQQQPSSAKTDASDHAIRAMERAQRNTKSLPSSPIHATPPISKHESLTKSSSAAVDDKKSLQESAPIVPESAPHSTVTGSPLADEAVVATTTATKNHDTDASGAISQQSVTNEPTTSKQVTEKELTQQEIVERIGQIENDISMYEELLEEVTKREEAAAGEDPIRAEEEEEETTTTTLRENEDQKEQDEREAAKQQALQVISEDHMDVPDIEKLSLTTSPIMRKKPQLLINQVRSNDETDDLLSEKLLQQNRQLARQNSLMIGGWQGKKDDPETWSNEIQWSKPLYGRIEDYPCYKDNIQHFNTIKCSVAANLAGRKAALAKKEQRLRREYKRLYQGWKKRNLTLDRIREQQGNTRRRGHEESDECVDGVNFSSNKDVLRFGTDNSNSNNSSTTKNTKSNGPWTSDAVRSEAELLEIIQSLESADMRNPELRAAKTTATIPPMILDIKERMRTFDDRSGLVTDPLTFYHTGADTEDHWTQQEMAAFMESYMQYPKQFEKIAAAVKSKTAPQCVLFYYRKKQKIDFKALVSKGRRGRAGKRRDRLAEAIRRATGEGPAFSTRKAKSKGSALMTDIGEAQVSRKAKQKESERKSRELRELEEANAYWDSVNERRRNKRSSGSSSQQSSNVDEGGQQQQQRRFPRRKGRSPQAPANYTMGGGEDGDVYGEMDDGGDASDKGTTTTTAPTAKWTEKDKETAIDAFKRHGRNFVRVSSLVGTKTEDQCRNFYHNFKRKYGPNAFNEESATTTTPSQSSTTTTTNTDRMGLKADEEDAAAALMGMCQMDSTKSSTPPPPPPRHARAVSIQLDESRGSDNATTTTPPPPTTGMVTGNRRRRARTSSGKVIDKETMDEWMDAEFSGRSNHLGSSKRPGRGGAVATAAATAETSRRPAYSSYWSVAERTDFLRYLEKYGCDWEKVANALTSKTPTQVRNFFMNNNEKMQLDSIVKRYEENMMHLRQQQDHVRYNNNTNKASHYQHHHQPQPQPPPPPIHNLPFPSAIVTEQPKPYQPMGGPSQQQQPPSSHMDPRLGYFTPSPPIPPPSQQQQHPVAAPPQPQPPPITSPPLVHPYATAPYATSSPTPSTVYDPLQHHRTTPHHSHYPPQQPPSSAVPYPTMHVDRPAPSPPVVPPPLRHHHHPQQQQQHPHHHNPIPPPPPSAQSHPVQSVSEPTSVTKVADLLNNDEPTDTASQSKNWESWFS